METGAELIAREKEARAKQKQPKLLRLPMANLVAMNVRDFTAAARNPRKLPRFNPLEVAMIIALLVLLATLALR